MNKSETRYEKETVCTLTEGPCQEQRNKVGESRTWGQQTSPLTLTSWCASAFMRFSSLLSDNAFFPALKDSQPERGLRCFCHRMLGLFTNQLAACNSAVYVTAFVAWGLLKIQSYLPSGMSCQRCLSEFLTHPSKSHTSKREIKAE